MLRNDGPRQTEEALLQPPNEDEYTYSQHVRLRVSVKDNGVGVHNDDKAKLFKMFGKVGSHNEKLNPHGIGLGLTICNKILGQMGSHLQLSSEYGQGAEFFFEMDVPLALS